MLEKKWINIKEAIILTDKSDKTIRNWIKENKVEAEFSHGLKRWRINLNSLLNFIEYESVKDS